MSVSVVLSLLWDSVKRQCRKHWRVGAGAVLVAVCLRQLGRYRVYLLVSRKIRQKQRQCRAAFLKIENNLKMTVVISPNYSTICDVIRKKVSYGGTYSASLDKLYYHVFDSTQWLTLHRELEI